ncbi:MAG: sucrose phosphorylase, partial [Symbiobacteriaceae bacterium]|nr:sucrose phosphorylase [Symbiobacteriaceae bacterium]
IGGTYYEVLGRDDDAYLAARAIQFFTPGIPQVYYVGLLAGENDYEAVKETGEGRAMNRHNYTLPEIEQALERDVVQRLLKLIQFRNEYPAFDGEFQVMDSASDEVKLSWRQGEKRCDLFVDLKTKRSVIEYIDEAGKTITYTV